MDFRVCRALLTLNNYIIFIGSKRENGNEESSKGKRKFTAPKSISILQILSIPTIWFSFVTFIVATMCNGFLSINLEPKVSNKHYIEVVITRTVLFKVRSRTVRTFEVLRDPRISHFEKNAKNRDTT